MNTIKQKYSWGQNMKGITIEERAINLAHYIIETKETVRSTAKIFGVSKSTVHKDVSERLKSINLNLYKEVKKYWK